MTNDKKALTADSLRHELANRGREVWLAGLGALATVEEEGTKLFSRLVERGQQFEEERRADLEAASEKAREQRDETIAQLEEASEETRSALTNTVHSALERMGVPSQKEVDRLAEKVDALSAQVDDLTTALSERETSTANGDET